MGLVYDPACGVVTINIIIYILFFSEKGFQYYIWALLLTSEYTPIYIELKSEGEHGER